MSRQSMITARARFAIAMLLAFWSAAASAHHPMGGTAPETPWQGLLSGIGHPIIGVDHFVFLLGLSALACLAGARGALPLAGFVVATTAGTLIHVTGTTLPWPETLISISLLTAGGLLLLRARPRAGTLTALVTLAGLWHGFAYGEAVAGSPTGALGAYIVGITAVQTGVLAGISFVFFRLGRALPHGLDAVYRAAGAAVGLVGAGSLGLGLIG